MESHGNRQPSSANRVAVVGGGINGAGIAWELARRDYDVTLFEKGECGAQTSSRSTKMIHGGLRYLEHLQFELVRESLRERAWLLEHVPQLVRPIEILLPVYGDSPRSRFTIRAGLTLYDLLSGRQNIERHRSLSVKDLLSHGPLLSVGCAAAFRTGTRRSTTTHWCAPWWPPPQPMGQRSASRRR